MEKDCAAALPASLAVVRVRTWVHVALGPSAKRLHSAMVDCAETLDHKKAVTAKSRETARLS